MNDAPLTPVEIARHLGQLSAELSELVRQLNEADADHTRKKEAFVLAEAMAYRQASGTLPLRKAISVELTHGQRLAAEEAELVVRQLRRKLDALKVRIDVGRSFGAAVRAEANLLNGPFGAGP